MLETKDSTISDFSDSVFHKGSIYAASIIREATSTKDLASGLPDVNNSSLATASSLDNPACLSSIILIETPCRELHVFLLSGAAHPETNAMKTRIGISLFKAICSLGNLQLRLKMGHSVSATNFVEPGVYYANSQTSNQSEKDW